MESFPRKLILVASGLRNRKLMTETGRLYIIPIRAFYILNQENMMFNLKSKIKFKNLSIQQNIRSDSKG